MFWSVISRLPEGLGPNPIDDPLIPPFQGDPNTVTPGVAGFFAIFLFSWLIYAGFEGLNVVFAPWLSALIVSAVLLIVVAILALAGLSSIKKNKDFDDLEAVDSIKDDVNMVRGLGYAADGTNPLDDLPAPSGSGATVAAPRTNGDVR
mgnify:CR=1 FL=1